MAAWRTQGLPDGADSREQMLKEVGIAPAPAQPPVDLGVDFRMMPLFEEKVLEHAGGHYVVRDWKGNICEISDEFDVSYLRQPRDFCTRRWISCPVSGRDDWERMKPRYNPDQPGRFGEDFADRARRCADRDWVLSVEFPGPFWQMREWCGFEALCIMTIDQPDLVAEMADFWTRFVANVLERILDRVVPDRIGMSEDMAYKHKAMISPAMTRRFCKPSYDCWAELARAAGVPIIDMDSDGFIGELIPIWVASGINVCNPMEVAAGNDINAFRREFGRKIAYWGGVDKRAMAKGGQVIREELQRIEPVVRDGGYIPGCDHGVPSDISWPNFLDYCRLLAQITGWL